MATVSRRDWRDGVTGSLFAYEGLFIAMLRSRLCLTGWPWPVADQAARDVVGEALRKAGAMRPSVEDAQYSYGNREIFHLRKEYCATCGGDIPTQRVKFCCDACYRASKAPATWVQLAHERQTCEVPAPYLGELAPEDTCDGCGATLTSVAHNRKYCTIECRNQHRAELRKNPVRNVACENCGADFQTTDPRKASCSPSCAKAAYKKRKRAAA